MTMQLELVAVAVNMSFSSPPRKTEKGEGTPRPRVPKRFTSMPFRTKNSNFTHGKGQRSSNSKDQRKGKRHRRNWQAQVQLNVLLSSVGGFL
jgi:hypothetical protein